MEIITAAVQLERIHNGEVEENEDLAPEAELAGTIDDGFNQMAILYQAGERFNQAAYASHMVEVFLKTQGPDEAWICFSHYNRFIVLIQYSKELPDILKRFRSMGLSEWANLRADRRPFQPFARGFVAGAEALIAAGEEIDASGATNISKVAELYRIELSVALRTAIDFQIFDTPPDDEDEDAPRGGGAKLRLQ